LIFQGKFPENFDFFQVISQKISISQGKFKKNFEFLGNLTKNFDFFVRQFKKNSILRNSFFRQFSIKFLFSRKISIFLEAISPKVNFSGQIYEKYLFFR